MRMELTERRVLGAVEFVDAITRLPVRDLVRVVSDTARFVRNRRAHYVIWEANGLESHTRSFTAPPATPALEELSFPIRVIDAGRSYLPRSFTVRLPRDPDPAHAGRENSLFRPVEIVLFPSPSAQPAMNWAVLYATVQERASGRRLPGVLLRVMRASDNVVLARGLTEWRAATVGEALVAVPGIPITTFAAGEGAVMTTQVEAMVEAIFDPGVDLTQGQLPNPDDLEARRATLRRVSVATQLKAGQRRSLTIEVP